MNYIDFSRLYSNPPTVRPRPRRSRDGRNGITMKSSTPNDATLDALRKKTKSELENLIEDAKEALRSLEMDSWTTSIYKMLITNVEKVLKEKEAE